MKTFLALFTNSQVRQHPIREMERSCEELGKVKDFYRQNGAGTREAHWAKKQGEYCRVTFL